MAKLKKHELLEKAMRDYPAGTVARFKSAPNVDHISDGTFKILEDDFNGVAVLDGAGANCFYSENCKGERDPQWAVPVPKSILTGKCAIQVNNEREFKLLMEHYSKSGWKCEDGSNITDSLICHAFPFYVDYSDAPYSMKSKKLEVEIIPFDKFAAEVGIEVPVFVRNSEDGVPLYVGDRYYGVTNIGKGWGCLCLYNVTTEAAAYLKKMPHEAKAFSTKEAAEAFIAEQNKPKEIRLFGENDECTVVVRSDGGISIEGIKIHKGEIGINFPTEDVEKVIEAYKSLQP